MRKSKNIPVLRFKEFDGEWTNRKLGELILKLDSGVSVNSIDEPAESIDQFGILKTSCISSGKFYPEQNKKIIEEDLDRAKLNPVKGSILISRMNTPQLVGHSGLIEKDYPNLFVPDRLWMTIIDTKKTNPKLLSVILSSEKTMGMISNIATGTSGSMKNISKPNFLNLEIHFPTLPEQQKIATFLSAIDEKIQQLTRKKELLEQYKKGVMQQLFSGKLRFKDENGKAYPKWEEKRLGDVGDIVSGLTYSPVDVHEDGVLVLRSSNVQDRRLTFDDNVYVKVDVGDFNPVKENDILICVRNGSKNLIGKNALVNKENAGLAFGAFMTVYRSDFNSYLFHYFDTDSYKDEVHKNLGATINSINGSDLKKFKIPFPCKTEQQKIASFLTRLDTKIESVAAQIAQSQTFKKGLLQQMFV
jgi:type I restriction enzyme, S subunit